ncbi:MAG: hypothetical protein ACPW60_00685 [Methylohalobius sp. ZOD2]
MTESAITEDLKQENELLLLQLHQVQEELEHYYLECQKLKKGAPHKSYGTADSTASASSDSFAGTPSKLLSRLVKKTKPASTGTPLNDIVISSPQYRALSERNAQLDADLERSRKEVNALNQKLGQLTEEVDAHQQREEKKAAELSELEKKNQQLTQDNNILAKEKVKLEEERDRQTLALNSVTSELEKNRGKNAQLEAELRQSQEEVHALNGNIKELTEKVETYRLQEEQRKTELAELAKKNEHLAQENTALASKKTALEKQIEENRSGLQSAKSDLSIALRLQSLREADLKDLQKRYSEILKTKKSQDELLAKLQKRLSDAAQYLRVINSQDDDGNQENLAQNLVRALSGETAQ